MSVLTRTIFASNVCSSIGEIITERKTKYDFTLRLRWMLNPDDGKLALTSRFK